MVFSAYTVVLVAGVALAMATDASAAPLDGGVPAAEVDRIAAMLGDGPFAFGPTIDDRAVWEKLGEQNATPAWWPTPGSCSPSRCRS